ncbi:MAG: biopolymer transporter ExbD [Pirellulaceae bacterium]|jgi:biopolymer transport protein ExbD|nr:biopolymer transporter ExbD [Pirellulaceae bacterium]
MRLPPSQADNDGPNLTPLIDVVFLLLIFFLVATRFDQQEKEVSTKLAEVLSAQPLSMPPNEVVVNISEEGKYIVVGEELSEKMLTNMLHTMAIKNPGTQRIQIRADQNARFVFPAKVMGICERENIEHYCTVIMQRTK